MRHRKLHHRIVFAGIIGAMALSSAGCALVAVGAVGAAGGYAYAEGRERRTFAVDMDTAWEAVHTAVRELGMEITSDTRTPGSGELAARWGAKGTSVRIFGKAVGSGSSMIGVRAGVADQSKNLEIMRRIELSMPPGTPPSKAYE